jgi:tellurite resistance protein
MSNLEGSERFMPGLKAGVLLLAALAALALEESQANAQQACTATATATATCGSCPSTAPSAAPCTPDEAMRRLKGRIYRLEMKIVDSEKADTENANLYAQLKKQLEAAKDELERKIAGLGGKMDKAEAAIIDIGKRIDGIDGRLIAVEKGLAATVKGVQGLEDRMNAGSRNSVGLSGEYDGGVGAQVEVAHDWHQPGESGFGGVFKVGYGYNSMGVKGCEGSISTNSLDATVGIEGRVRFVKDLLSATLGVDGGVTAQFRGGSPNVQGGHTYSPLGRAELGLDFDLGGGVSAGIHGGIEAAKLPDRAGAQPDWDVTPVGGVRVRVRLPRRGTRGR